MAHSSEPSLDMTYRDDLSCVVRKSAFCICENKDGNREADQSLCFRYTDSTISLLLKSEISSLYLYSPVCVGPGRTP